MELLFTILGTGLTEVTDNMEGEPSDKGSRQQLNSNSSAREILFSVSVVT